ncbi:hypothetical protein [Tychonema sp. LEGE 07203]|uniref:hypothetical protein n=1 Tax=Tychonema sp. LEGE 07203 TaxID=1828671 RepID=UPI0019EBE144|nr:hypothetical protein [Tychonema sp. LEGE 07203]MBE9097475.1 hypothetical protein [Tychonema sp. LEGE 07203]
MQIPFKSSECAQAEVKCIYHCVANIKKLQLKKLIFYSQSTASSQQSTVNRKQSTVSILTN